MESRVSIFFDLDGTLCDPREGIIRCFRYAFDESGFSGPPDEQLERFIGPPLRETFAALLDGADVELIERAVALYRQRFVAKGMYENNVYPGIAETLSALRSEHYRLYVVTAKPTVFAQRILVHFGLQGIFRNTYGCELDGSRTHKAELIAHVLKQEKISPGDAVMVGDREHDVKGALANGVVPIGVLWGYGTREELVQAGAALLCDSPEALANSLRSRRVLEPMVAKIFDRKG